MVFAYDLDESIFFTVSIRLVLSNMDKPTTLQRVCRARVYRPDETFWLVTDRRPVHQDYTIYMSEVSLLSTFCYCVDHCTPSGRARFTSN